MPSFQIARRRAGLSLTAALREATEVWMAQQEEVDPDDPLFEILEDWVDTGDIAVSVVRSWQYALAAQSVSSRV
jgi:hypothetical protein